MIPPGKAMILISIMETPQIMRVLVQSAQTQLQEMTPVFMRNQSAPPLAAFQLLL